MKYKHAKHKRRIKRKILIMLIILLISIMAVLFLTRNRIKIDELYFNENDKIKEIGKTISLIEYSKTATYAIQYPTVGNKKIDKNIKKEVDNLVKQYLKKYENNKKKNTYYEYITYETYLAPDNIMSLVLTEIIELNQKVIDRKMYSYSISLKTGEFLKDTYIFKGKYNEALLNLIEDKLNNNKKYKKNLVKNYKEKLNNYTLYLNNKEINIVYNSNDILPEKYGIINLKIDYEEFSKYMNIDYNNKTKKPKINITQADEITYSDIDKMMYTETVANIYEKDNKNSNTIAMLDKGSIVKVVGLSESGWCKVIYNDKTGYINSVYIQDDPIAMEGYQTVYEEVYALEKIEVRSEASVESSVLGEMQYRDAIERIGIGDNGWSEVLFGGGIAYINSGLLSTVMPADTAIPLNVDPQRGIDSGKPMVAITFDDGPNPYSTSRILDVLEKYNAGATFFDLGSLVYSYPDIVRREEAIGCEVGSHTYSHYNLNTLSSDQIAAEVAKSDDAVNSVLGHNPVLIRPPYGNANATVRASVGAHALINWDIDTLDWQSKNVSSILNEINKYESLDGRIILMHSIYSSTADAIEVLVPQLISKGYQLVTVSELARYKGYSLESGSLYYNFR